MGNDDVDAPRPGWVVFLALGPCRVWCVGQGIGVVVFC